MSQAALETIVEFLDDYGGQPAVDDLKKYLQSELDVKRATSNNYVSKYIDWEEDAWGDKWVKGLNQEAQIQVQELKMEEVQESIEPGDFGIHDPVPDPIGVDYHSVPIRQPGHPLVPTVRAYVERPMHDGDKITIDKETTDVQLVTKAMASKDFGVLLIGEPGTGKGHLVKKICSETNWPLRRVNFGTRITKEKLVGGFIPVGNGDGLKEQLDRARKMAKDNDDLSVEGALQVLNIREKFKWKDGLLTQAVKNGWVFLADELNAAPPEATMPLHGLLEDADSRTLELTEKGEVIDVHDDFTFVGTMNPPHHHGTQPLNHAFKDRLIPIPLPYLKKDAEVGLLRSKYNHLTKEEAIDLVKLANDLRRNYPKDISVPCTPRTLFKIAEMAEVLGVDKAAEQVLLTEAEDETDKDSIRRKMSL